MSESRNSSEIRLLKDEVQILRARVDHLTHLVEDLLSQVNSGSGEWETVSVVETQAGYTSAPPVTQATSGTAASSSGEQAWEEREKICKEVGHFVRRALSGQHRGVSGRNRIKLASRLWLVFRTIQGVVHTEPCLLLHRFSEVKELCFEENETGDSVFIGLPSLREASWVAAAAGCSLPRDQ